MIDEVKQGNNYKFTNYRDRVKSLNHTVICIR